MSNLKVATINPEPENATGILPTEYKVLVKPKDIEEKVGSIYIPEQVKDRDQHAQIEGDLVAISPLAFSYDGWPDGARKPQVGDRVFYAKYSGAEVEGKDGKKYRLINDKDIGAVLV